MTSDLDRLLELEGDYGRGEILDAKTTKEYESLKSRLEEQLENWNKYGKDYGFRIQTLSNDRKELEAQVKQLQEENQFLKETCGLCAEEQENLKAKLDEIKAIKFDSPFDYTMVKAIIDKI